MPGIMGLGEELPSSSLLDWEKDADKKRQQMLAYRDKIKTNPLINQIGYDSYNRQMQGTVNQSQASLSAAQSGAQGRAKRAAEDRQRAAEAAQRKAQEDLNAKYEAYLKNHPYQNQGSLTTQPGPNYANSQWAANGQVAGLEGETYTNAQAIANEALRRGLGREGVIAGIMTALTESSLRNVGHGDQMGPSSRGLFQQMPKYWGPESVIMDPTGAAGLFFDKWVGTSGDPWTRAQAVQQSEFTNGSNYKAQYQRAVEIADQMLSPATASSWQQQPAALRNSGATTGLRQSLVTTTLSALGTPYQWGGESLKGGVDCSGLVKQVYASIGIQLPHSANQQSDAYGSDTNIYGRRVPLAQLQPGDLVAWDHNRSGERSDFVGHIAVYIGNGQIVEAYSRGQPVRQRPLRTNEEHIYGVHMTLPGDR